MLGLLLLAQVNAAFTLPVLGHPGVAQDFPEQIAQLCDPAHPSNSVLLNRESRMLAQRVSGPGEAKAMRDLGCVRALLAVNGATGREGLFMGTGESYEVGAARAFSEALLLTPTDSTAAAGLALLALDLRNGKHVPKMNDALASAIGAGNTRSGLVLRAAAKVALDRGDEATALRVSQQVLAEGHDSTSALLVLARLSARHGDSLATMQEFIAAGGASRAGPSREEFDWQLQWFLSPAEDTVWQQLPDTARAGWIRDRVVSRDIRDGRSVGARVTEHFARLEYVEAHFRIQVPPIKRNQLLYGVATTEQFLAPSLKPKGSGINKLRMGKQSCDGAGVPADSMREYRRWQLDFDDRGVAWMRFGEPFKRVFSTGAPSVESTLCGGRGAGEANLVREAWLYRVDGSSFVLSFEAEGFDSSVEATRFVTRVLGDYFCDIDTKRCNASSLFRAGMLAGKVEEFLPPEKLEAIMWDDRTTLARAVTTDDNSRRVEHPVGMEGSFYRLWDPATGAPKALITYALKIGDLQPTPTDGGGKGAIFDLTLHAWDPGQNRTTDTTLTRRVRIPASAGSGDQLTGAMVVPSSPGVTAWSLFATQGEDRQGRAAQESAPPLDAGGLTISDIVLGEARQGLTALLGNTRLVLAPLGAVDQKLPISVYYQLRSAVMRSDAEMTVALFRLNGAPKAQATAVLEIRFPAVIHAGLNEVERTMDISHVAPGTYRLEVLVHDRTTGTTTRRSTPLNIH